MGSLRAGAPVPTPPNQTPPMFSSVFDSALIFKIEYYYITLKVLAIIDFLFLMSELVGKYERSHFMSCDLYIFSARFSEGSMLHLWQAVFH